MLTMTVAAVVTTGAFAGGFVSGLAGFGTGLVALGFWLYVIEPAPAATLVAVCSVIAQVQTLRTIWHDINASRIWPIVVAGLLGVPIGTMLLSKLDPATFRLSVGMFLIAFSAFMMTGRIRPRVTWGGRMADSAIGFAGGVLGGLAGLSGPLPTAWATLRGWNKAETRGVLQVFSLVVLAAVVAWHFAWGLLGPEVGLLVLVAIPGTTIGALLGARVYRRLSDRRFNEVLLCLLGLSGFGPRLGQSMTRTSLQQSLYEFASRTRLRFVGVPIGLKPLINSDFRQRAGDLPRGVNNSYTAPL